MGSNNVRCNLAVSVEFPVSLRNFLRRVQYRVFEGWVGHVRLFIALTPLRKIERNLQGVYCRSKEHFLRGPAFQCTTQT
jgi:CRISPR/Cas system-associated endoribonuclease Cas2